MSVQFLFYVNKVSHFHVIFMTTFSAETSQAV